QAYAKQAKDTEMITKATEIRMRAERRCGELLIEMAKRRERLASKDALARGRKLQPREAPKLADLGISKTQSSRWQRLAALDIDTWEARVEAGSKRAYARMTGRSPKEAEIERAKQGHAKLVEQGCTIDEIPPLAESGKNFPVIYVAPPWPWDTFGPLGRI